MRPNSAGFLYHIAHTHTHIYRSKDSVKTFVWGHTKTWETCNLRTYLLSDISLSLSQSFFSVTLSLSFFLSLFISSLLLSLSFSFSFSFIFLSWSFIFLGFSSFLPFYLFQCNVLCFVISFLIFFPCYLCLMYRYFNLNLVQFNWVVKMVFADFIPFNCTHYRKNNLLYFYKQKNIIY